MYIYFLEIFSALVFVFLFGFVIYCAHFEAVLDIFLAFFLSFALLKLISLVFRRKCSYFVFSFSVNFAAIGVLFGFSFFCFSI